jgi:murein DD-endopeptidase MepM/ murein hydrolase activator NlpD
MRSKLSLTICLAAFAACVVAGTAVGQDEVVGSGEGAVEIDLPDGEQLEDLESLPECSNLADDDADQLVDLDDPECTSPLDTSESESAPPPAEPVEPAEPPAPPAEPTEPAVPEIPAGETFHPDEGVSGPRGADGRGGGHKPDKPGRGNRDGDRDEDSNGSTPDDASPDEQPTRRPDGTPTDANPGLTIADFGPAPIGVPNFVIDQFSIPPFLLPIYQACGTQYGIPWQVLASINRIETAFGTNLNVSSAGAMGWMQFIPSSWEAYGVDANDDGRKDPYNPVDAICAAGRYLRAAGGQEDLRRAIFAYNHADWYVDEVLLYANQYGKLPEPLVSSLTGLTEGARFPVAANARYADDISERRALKRSTPGRRAYGNAAEVISSSPTRRGIDIFSREGAPVVAVNDGVITEVGRSKRLGRYLVLRDAYGNRFTYAQLGEVSNVYPVPKRDRLSADDFKLVSPAEPDAPEQPASAGGDGEPDSADAQGPATEGAVPTNTEDSRERLYAFPERPRNADRANLTGQLDRLLDEKFPGYESFKAYFSGVLRFDDKTMELRPLKEGARVTAGTVLGRIGKTDELAPRLHFAIRPAGRGAPKIDPKPILDGWKLLEATAIYRAAGENPFEGGATTGQVLLMSKPQLVRRVLADPRLEIYACGREDIRTGQIDRRTLALLEYLAERGFRLTITSLKCGHSFLTSSGSVSHHSSGNAVDIALINDIPVLGNQGPGSITEALVRDVMDLQGTMRPAQIISLMDFGADNTFAMGDHDDHVHVGYTPAVGPGSTDVSQQFEQILKPEQWGRLIDRIGEIDNPSVPTSPSRYATPAQRGHGEKSAGGDGTSGGHDGE